jgi:hypothetical protein
MRMWEYGVNSYGSSYGPESGSWENDNEPSYSLKGEEFLDQLSNC